MRRNKNIERWLREDVAQAYDEMKADPSRGVSLAKAFAELRAHHAKRLKAKG